MGFCHEAFLYGSEEQFLHGTATFIRDGLAANEPTLVVVDAWKIVLLRGALGKDAEHVQFADMAEVGSNPARIIHAWRDFVDERAPGRPVRGIGEPIGPDRNSAQLVECQRHESLLNLAFADTPAFWLMCPYDTEALGLDVVDEALHSHPIISSKDIREGEPPLRWRRDCERPVQRAAAGAVLAAKGVLLRSRDPGGAAPVRAAARNGCAPLTRGVRRISCWP